MWAGTTANDTHSCALADSTTLPVSDRTRCPFYGNETTPKDRTWGQIAEYFRQVASHYTNGSFIDENGMVHTGGRHYKFGYWEILNEPSLSREHGLSPDQIISYYDAMVASLGSVAPGGGKFLGSSFASVSAQTVITKIRPFLDPATHDPPSTPVDALSFHMCKSRFADSTNFPQPDLVPCVNNRRCTVQKQYSSGDGVRVHHYR